MPVRRPRSAVARAGMVLRRPSGSRVRFVEVRGGEYLAVEPGGEVGVAVEEGDVVGGDAVSGTGTKRIRIQ